MFTSSYRGVFDRLLARMRQEGLTGDQLLTGVHYRHFRVFIKSAAVFNRLTMFLATIPSPVARWSLLTRCLSDLERTTDVTEQAVTAAEIVSAPLDRDSLRLIRDTLRSEYIAHGDGAQPAGAYHLRSAHRGPGPATCVGRDRSSAYGHCCPLSARAPRSHRRYLCHPVSQRREYPPVFFLQR